MSIGTTTPTVAELEERILSGGTVTPSEMAQAKAHGEASAKIARLTEQRENEKARLERVAVANQLGKEIEKDLTKLQSETDQQLAAALAQIEASVKAYCERVHFHRQGLTALRRRIDKVRAHEPSANHGVDHSDGLVVANDAIGRDITGDFGEVVNRRVHQLIAADRSAKMWNEENRGKL